jgi:hypothetical protein
MESNLYFDVSSLETRVLSNGGGYVHRDCPVVMNDPYPELTESEYSRMPAYVLFSTRRFRKFDKEKKCSGYMPKDGSYPCRGGKVHHGMDISCEWEDRGQSLDGLTVPFDATIIKSGVQSGYGNRIELVLEGTNTLLMYSHLNRVQVKTGQKIKAGTIIAYEHNSGCEGCGPHLHLEVADGNQTKWAIGSWLPHARTLFAAGALRNPWFIFDFSKNTDDGLWFDD